MCMCLCMGMGMCKGKCMCVLSLLVCCFLFSEVKFLDLLEDEQPQNHLQRMLSLITNEG